MPRAAWKAGGGKKRGPQPAPHCRDTGPEPLFLSGRETYPNVNYNYLVTEFPEVAGALLVFELELFDVLLLVAAAGLLLLVCFLVLVAVCEEPDPVAAAPDFVPELAGAVPVDWANTAPAVRIAPKRIFFI